MARITYPTNSKEAMKSLVLLWRWVAEESATWCCTSTYLDIKTVEVRTKSEGLSFLTITLPAFGKDFERSLDLGYIDPSFFRSFKKNGRIPAFLQGIVGQVFDRKTGKLVATPSIDCIRLVRQLTLMFKKLEVDCTPRRQIQAVQGYLDCEVEVRKQNEELSDQCLNDLGTMSAFLYGNIHSEVERKLISGDLLPKHGPGATADRLRGNSKFDLSEWPVRLDHSFSYERYALPNDREEFVNDLHEYFDGVPVTSLYPEQERPVKVTLVPKTLEKPRIIAIEPTAMQYAQQSLMREYVELLESPTIPNDWFTSRRNRVFGMIGFQDQEPNNLLAKEGSLNGNLATLDLSEASDRVSNLHVMAMTAARFPTLTIGIQDCRSTKAVTPSIGRFPSQEIHLAKFASMGSALTFPFEAMVFLTIIFLGIQQELNRPLTEKDILFFSDKVRVYGDDIIIPVEYVHTVTSLLTLYGYKVNASKSFWTGMFRESCGMEYYSGVDVTIKRVTRVMPQSRHDVQEIISLVELRNDLFMRGYSSTAGKLDRIIGKFLPLYPVVQPSSPILGRYSYDPTEFSVGRMDKNTQTPLVKGFVVSSNPPLSPVSGRGALLKYFLKKGLKPFDMKHLERYGRPERVSIKVSWSRPF